MKGLLGLVVLVVCSAISDERIRERIVHVENMELLLRGAQLGFDRDKTQEAREVLIKARSRFDTATAGLLQIFEQQEADLREREAELQLAFIRQLHNSAELEKRFHEIESALPKLPLHLFEGRAWPNGFAVKENVWSGIIRAAMDLDTPSETARSNFLVSAYRLSKHLCTSVGAPSAAIGASLILALDAYRDQEIAPRTPQQEHSLKKIRIALRLVRIRRERIQGIIAGNAGTDISSHTDSKLS